MSSIDDVVKQLQTIYNNAESKDKKDAIANVIHTLYDVQEDLYNALDEIGDEDLEYNGRGIIDDLMKKVDIEQYNFEYMRN